MPRDSGGVYSRANPSVAANTVIASAVYNGDWDDVVSELNTATPISRGGTGATSASAARAALNVAPQQEGVGDTTSGAGLIVGAFGLGSTAITEADWDTTSATRSTQTLRTATTSVTGAPSTVDEWVGWQNMKSANIGVQVAWGTTAGRSAWRKYASGAWSDITRDNQDLNGWYEIRSIVALEDDGAGNIAIRYSDGIQEAHWVGAELTCSDAQGSGFVSSTETWTFPLEFISTTGLVVTTDVVRSAGGPWAGSANVTSPITVTAVKKRLNSWTVSASGNIHYMARGYWR